jgi:cytochrome P450
VGNFIRDAYGSLVYFGLVSHSIVVPRPAHLTHPQCASMPLLDRLIVKNPLMKPFLGEPPFLLAFQRAFAAVAERKKKHETEGTSPGSSDYLDLFLASRDSYPEIVTGDDVVVNYCFLNVVAGSDTTGTSLAVILYYVYHNPEILHKVREELAANQIDGSSPGAFRELSRLPYLDAVIQEGLRIHPPIGLTLERVVPSGGWQVPDGGPYLPAGTKVGMNSWVSNRDEKLYGPEDVDQFIPERWMPRAGESDEEWKSRISRMKGLLFTFGFGKRICTGKSVAMLELYKLVASFMAKYEVCSALPRSQPLQSWARQWRRMMLTVTCVCPADGVHDARVEDREHLVRLPVAVRRQD